MSTTTRPAPWWRTAPNPPCSPWCEATHAPDEFTMGGGMSCRRTLVETDYFEVAIDQYHGVTSEATEGVVTSDPIFVYVRTPGLHDEFLNPDEAEAIVADLAAAVARAAKEVRGHE